VREVMHERNSILSIQPLHARIPPSFFPSGLSQRSLVR
jgi:hypothetical protein